MEQPLILSCYVPPIASPCDENNTLSDYFGQRENLAREHNHFAQSNLRSLGMKNKHKFSQD